MNGLPLEIFGRAAERAVRVKYEMGETTTYEILFFPDEGYIRWSNTGYSVRGFGFFEVDGKAQFDYLFLTVRRIKSWEPYEKAK